ncbi:ACT domain-containing protein ACR2 isoform X1 [Vitis riparia]|uniref:ACT domain-containing protein ACR2 isoform X1 n=2 Tax=Vitis riparia TaxID=96939 RepID=UPI00155AF699|nr:ACT domain-containing protein ACR2 isoform X1 [Vitis riparia]
MSTMNKVCSPYFDPEFDELPERIFGPTCRVCIDNESLEDCTLVKVNSINKQGILLEVVKVLTEMNLTISKSYISSDAGWFMFVFHVKDEHGNKLTDQRVINYIQQAIGTTREIPNSLTYVNNVIESEPASEHTAIEMSGADRPGLFSEISAALADLQVNIVEAHAWTHNERLACVAYITDQSTDSRIEDPHRLAKIEKHLATVLGAANISRTNHQEVKGADLHVGDATTTCAERRLHQLMLSVEDFEGPSAPTTSSSETPLGLDEDDDEGSKAIVSIESCNERGYSIVSIECKDRQRLMFDVVCTITDMQYLIFHGSTASHGGYAMQEYFIRHIDGCIVNSEGEKEHVVKCLEAAIERRVCEGVRLELCANNRLGLLSDITRVLRENGLAVVRADVETQGEKAVNAFYVKDLSGNDVDTEFTEPKKKEKFIESVKKEMGPIDLAVKKEITSSPSSPDHRPRFSVADMVKSHVDRLSNNFIPIKN